MREPQGTQLDLDVPTSEGGYTNMDAAVIDSVLSPEGDGTKLPRFEVGRYQYTDDVGLKNGMLYFYDVTAYSSWVDANGNLQTLSSQPAALESEGVRPMWQTVAAQGWQEKVMVVPNPWRGGAAWDLTPSDADPTGTHLDFARLPEEDCTLHIYTLAGDLVQDLRSNGRGTIRWNMISRNGQDITSGVYLYTVSCDGETMIGRFTVIR